MSTAAIEASALLHHAWFTGMILMLASREGPEVVGDWIQRTFRRQHEAKFLSSFEKLGLVGLPHAVACARYHYLSNRIGGVEVEFMPESDQKAWVRFPHPRWIYEGTAICGVPESVSHGFLRGWYAQNGVSLGNPRLGFVCTSQDMTAEYGFSGYFIEEDRALGPEERLRFRSDEAPPRFDPALAPVLSPSEWTTGRLLRAKQRYAMDYVANGLAVLPAARGAAHARLAARLIGRQYYRRLQSMLGVGDGLEAFGEFLVAMAAGQGEQAVARGAGGRVTIDWQVGRAARHCAVGSEVTLAAWSGLWEGCLSTHDRSLALAVEHTGRDLHLRLTRQHRTAHA